MSPWRLAAMLVALSGATFDSGAQADSARSGPRAGTIDGIVTDTMLHPLGGAIVSIAGSDISVVTGANGRFRIVKVPVGEYTLLARRIGYRLASAEIEVADSEVLRASFSLERFVVRLDTLRVTSHNSSLSPKMEEFYARKRWGQGQFMTQDEIERRNSVETVDLLRTFLSVTVMRNGTGPAAVINYRSGCSFQILVDGIPAPPGLDLPSPKEVGGIELYSGPATIPLQYKGLGKTWCGLILIWLRDGSSG